MRSFEIGILGCGVISRTYISDIQRFFPHLHIRACADVRTEVAQKTCEEYEIAYAYTVEELLKDEKIEIVINLTPPQFHVELNKKILLAGKHVFTEKPFAPNIKEARAVLAIAEKTGKRIGCAPDTFLASGLQSVRFYLDAGIIGKPFFATANMTNFGVETWHPKPHAFYEKGSGPLFDMGPYYVSALVSLLGPVESVGAFGTKASPIRHIYVGEHAGEEISAEEDTTFCAILRLRSGVTVNLNITYDIYKSGLPAFEIYGDGGTLTYPDPNFGGGTPKVYRKEQYTDVCYRDDEEAQKRKQSYYELPEVFTRFKDYSRGIGVQDLAAAIESGTKNRANGELILHVTEVLQAIRESAEQGQFICLKTTCERPEPLIPGSYLDQI